MVGSLVGLLFTRPGSNPYYCVVSGYVTIDYVHSVFVDHVTFHETIFIGIVEALVVLGNYGDEFFRGSGDCFDSK